MAVTYTTAVKNARFEAVVAQIDAGSGPGEIMICTTGMASILAEFTLNDPSGTASGGV